jgi:hypothetical protein
MVNMHVEIWQMFDVFRELLESQWLVEILGDCNLLLEFFLGVFTLCISTQNIEATDSIDMTGVSVVTQNRRV